MGLDDDGVSRIGEQIRHLRVQRGLSLQQLSKKASVSVGLLSEIERGLASPTLRTIDKVREALSVSMLDFFRPEDAPSSAETNYVTRAAARRVVDLGPNRLVKEYLSTDNRFFVQQMVLVIPPQGGAGGLYSYPGEKCGLVLEGVFTLCLAGRDLELYAGDSFQFSSEIEHTFSNRSGKTVRVLWSIYRPKEMSL